MIGLREFSKEHKGDGLTYKVKELYWQLRYAWQRVWVGYDYRDISSFDFMFIQRIIPILKEFRENNVGLFYDHDKQRNLTEEETNAVIDEMIFHFENSNDDAWAEETDLNPSKGDDMNKIEAFEKDANEHRAKALEMFIKWFDQLWY